MDRLAKRTRSELEIEEERNERNKKGNSGRGNEPAMPGPDSTVYRILCPGNVVGSVIGKGGNVIKSLRKETRSKIKVADPVPGADERVILIFTSTSTTTQDKEKQIHKKKKKSENGDDINTCTDETLCPAQEGLVKVHGVIAAFDKDAKKQATARLVVAKSQIGTLIGKGGKNIQKMRSDSGADIQILRKEELPACALTMDELVQISGDSAAVKAALYAVSGFLHKHPPKEKIPWKDVLFPPVGLGQQSSLLPPGFLLPPANYYPQRNSLFAHNNIDLPPVHGHGRRNHLGEYATEGRSAWPLKTPTPTAGLGLSIGSSFGVGPTPTPTLTPSARKGKYSEEFTVRILCPSDKIGGVIGKGGNNIKHLRQETGASITVEDAKPDSDERVIVVSYTEFSDDGVSPTLEAILQLQGKTSASTDKDGAISTRLLVPSKQIGCLIGKGGNAITEMRKTTGANIQISKKGERPKCASGNEELVQITAEAGLARDALIQIVTRLRDNVFKDQDGAVNSGVVFPNSLPGLSMPGTFSLSSSYVARHDIGSPGRTAAVRSAGGFDRLGGFQGVTGSIPEPAYVSTGAVGGRKAIQLAIPNSIVGSVLGRGGTNISHIRQVSGATVKLHDPIPGDSGCIIEISGTTEQQRVAKSLIQGFMFSGQTQQSHLPLRAY